MIVILGILMAATVAHTPVSCFRKSELWVLNLESLQ